MSSSAVWVTVTAIVLAWKLRRFVVPAIVILALVGHVVEAKELKRSGGRSGEAVVVDVLFGPIGLFAWFAVDVALSLTLLPVAALIAARRRQVRRTA